MKNKKKNLVNYFKTKNHYIIQDESFHQKSAFFLSKGMIYLFGFLTFLVLSALIYFAIAFTSLKNTIPGFPKNATEVYEKDKENILKLSLLETKSENTELWIKNLQTILAEKDSLHLRDVRKEIEKDSIIDYKKIIFERSKIDSILRKKVELKSKLNQTEIVKNLLISSMKFQKPSDGKIVYSKNGNVKEITYRAKRKTPIKATMKGVILSKSNNKVIIQHQNNFVTVYKNIGNVKLNIGQEITSGKEIGVIRDSVFKFQLWYKGNSISKDAFNEL